MENTSRRNFNAGLLGSLFTFSLVETLFSHDALAKPIRAEVKYWLAEVEEASRAMQKQQLRQIEWQQKIADIFSRVDQKDLLRSLDFDRISKQMKIVGSQEAVSETLLKHIEGMPKELSFSTYIYGMKKNGVIPPHCHQNMTSMHMPIGGGLHGWHFDRVADESNYLIIKPTMDKALTLGEVTTVSDEKDNVHWFKPTSEVSYTFNILVVEIDPTKKSTGRQFYLDAAHGEKTDGDKLRVKKLNSKDSYRIYGK